MALCGICKSLDFFSLPSFPVHSDGLTDWYGSEHLPVFRRRRMIQARRAEEDTDAVEFSLSLGTPHHQSIHELETAAEACVICSLILQRVYTCRDLLADEIRSGPGPDYRLWLTRRNDGCDGFMVMSSGALHEAWLIAAVGFCVEDDDPLSSIFPGRVIQEDSVGEKTLSRALRWVHGCDTQHVNTRCCVAEVELPSRVLDVECDTNPSSIRLYEPEGKSGRYISLSHSWGTARHFTTTRKTLAERKEGIPFSTLPKTFQDAVFLTRKLGVRYLWTDSLCICQDDESDWERTSTVMASIYANAYLTIAATGSDGDSHGFFVRRTPPDYALFNYMVKDGTKGTLNAFLIPNSEAVLTNKYAELEKEPLTKRGWALQERTLASRVLHSGTQQLYFECYQQFLAEDGFHHPGRFFSIHEDSGRAATNADGSPVSSSRGRRQYRGASKLWYDALYLYWPRRLTKSSDKLPARAGIARAIEEKTGDQYVAGLWRSEMIQGLVWQAMGTPNSPTNTPLQYRAPSWSWASIDGPFDTLDLEGAWPLKDTRWTDIAIVLDCHVDLKGENPYGEVLGGWISIRAPLESLSPVARDGVDWETVPPTGYLRVKTRSGNPSGASCILDTVNDHTASELQLFALVMVRLQEPDVRSKDSHFQALVITPVHGVQNSYRRLGVILLGGDALGGCEWIGDDTKHVTVTLI